MKLDNLIRYRRDGRYYALNADHIRGFVMFDDKYRIEFNDEEYVTLYKEDIHPEDLEQLSYIGEYPNE